MPRYLPPDNKTTDPDVLRRVLVYNTESVTAPSSCLLAQIGVGADGVLRVGRPTANGQGNLLLNSVMPILPGAQGQAIASTPSVAAFQIDNTGGTAPRPGEIWGSRAGDWFLHRGYPGWLIIAAGAGSLVAVDRMEGVRWGGGPTIEVVVAYPDTSGYFPGRRRTLDIYAGPAADMIVNESVHVFDPNLPSYIPLGYYEGAFRGLSPTDGVPIYEIKSGQPTAESSSSSNGSSSSTTTCPGICIGPLLQDVKVLCVDGTITTQQAKVFIRQDTSGCLTVSDVPCSNPLPVSSGCCAGYTMPGTLTVDFSGGSGEAANWNGLSYTLVQNGPESWTVTVNATIGSYYVQTISLSCGPLNNFGLQITATEFNSGSGGTSICSPFSASGTTEIPIPGGGGTVDPLNWTAS